MTRLAGFLARPDDVVRVEVANTSGSTPREAGAAMFVAANAICGTIGGGRMEHLAIEKAREIITGRAKAATFTVALGPDTGQCCGGRATLALTPLDEASRAAAIREEAEGCDKAAQVLIFGAGHVGRALALALKPLPLRPILIDQREAELALAAPGVERRLTAIPEAEVAAAPPGSAFVILTHDHALDFLIAAEALARGDAAYVGMIGSATKRAAFAGWLRREKLGAADGLICPIGAAGVGDKRPPVIAAHVAAEIASALFGGSRAEDNVTNLV